MAYALPPEYQSFNNNNMAQMYYQPSYQSSRSSGSQYGYRVEKPRSTHSSPRHLQRRQTTAGAQRYAMLEDQLNAMYGLSGEDYIQGMRRTQTRPLSWHPSTQLQSYSQGSTPAMAIQTSNQNWAQTAQLSDFYSFPATEPTFPTQSTSCSTSTGSFNSQWTSPESFDNWQPQQHTYAVSAYSTPSAQTTPFWPSEWATNQMGSINMQQEANDFLPIQHPAAVGNNTAEVEQEEKEDGKELVALGLYDAPEPGLSSLTEGIGKGLKLEEEWQPPAEDKDDEEEDGASDDGSVDELLPTPAPQPTTQLPVYPEKPQQAVNMMGQSFFFDEDTTNNWWFSQMNMQPTPTAVPVPMQEQGLGYGWL